MKLTVCVAVALVLCLFNPLLQEVSAADHVIEVCNVFKDKNLFSNKALLSSHIGAMCALRTTLGITGACTCPVPAGEENHIKVACGIFGNSLLDQTTKDQKYETHLIGMCAPGSTCACPA